MPHHERVTVSGVIADVFAHRFVLETADGRVLADLTPKGAARIRLQPGARVTVSGERKPSEIKVDHFTPDGGETIVIVHAKPHEGEDDADSRRAVRIAEAAGYTVMGGPRRKPRHFEVLGRKTGGILHEVHIDLDGSVRTKEPDLEKWADEPPASPSGLHGERPDPA